MRNALALPTSFMLFLLLLMACGKATESPTAPTPSPTDEGPAGISRTPSPAGARVFFITPADGDVVSSPVRVQFGLTGMELAPAGDNRPNSGHHHLIIDSELPPFDQPIPKDEHHVHFGDGSSETMLELAPGRHTLQLLVGDYMHIPQDPPVYSEPITITVE